MEDSVNRHSVECSGTLPDAAIEALREGFAAALGLAIGTIVQQQEGEEGFAEAQRWARWLVPISNAWPDDVALAPKIDGAMAALASLTAPVDVTERSTE